MARRVRRLNPEAGQPVRFTLDGEPIEARTTDTVASALIAAGEWTFSRSVKYHRPRGPYCFSGTCVQCLCRVDGLPNVATCLTPVQPGMEVQRQNAYPNVKLDLVAPVDWLFPRGLDHHEMFTGSRILNSVMQRTARTLAGLGQVPAPAHPTAFRAAAAEPHRCDVLVIGAGPAGLAAARAAAESGAKVTVLERLPFAGGHLALGLGMLNPSGARAAQARAAALVDECEQAGAAIVREAELVGIYDGRRIIATVRHQLMELAAQRLIVCTGSYPTYPLFEDADKPGVLAARGLARLMFVDGVVPGGKVAVVGDGPDAAALGHALRAAGVELAAHPGGDAYADLRTSPPLHGCEGVRVTGSKRCTGLIVRWEGAEHLVRCDLVAVAERTAPAFEPVVQAGGQVVLDPTLGGWRAVVDGRQRTTADGVLAAGDVCGVHGGKHAQLTGEVAGLVAAAEVAGTAVDGARLALLERALEVHQQ